MAINNPTAKAPFVEGATHTGLCRVSFRVQAVTDLAPDNVIPAGIATTPLRASEGLYSVVIADFLKLPVLVAGNASILGAAAIGSDAKIVQIVSYTASTGVLVYSTWSAAATPAVADVANDEWVMFDLVFAQDAVPHASAALA